MVKHFVLTRFNLRLWIKDKTGTVIKRDAWLKDRVSLFEAYTLPSLAAQTCKDFSWIILVDDESPEWFRVKTKQWKDICPQIHFVGVPPQYHRYFARVFQKVVNSWLTKNAGENEETTVLTTYLDNDDAVRCDYIEDIQKLAADTEGNTFLYYDYGLQYFTEIGINTRIYYPNNHFTSLVERVSADTVMENQGIKTCYGYGSHFLVERNGSAKVKHIDCKTKPMWVEIIHKCNVDNDVKMTLDTKLWLKDNECFGCHITKTKHPRISFMKEWIPRAITQIKRRAKDKLHET